MLLSRERAKFSPARRKVKIAAGIAEAMSRANFGLTTPSAEIAAVRSKNEFLEAPYSSNKAIKAQRRCLQPNFILTKSTGKSTQITRNSS